MGGIRRSPVARTVGAYRSLIPEGFRGRIELVPIGPDPDEKRRLTTADLRRLAKRSDARLMANELSLIVVLRASIGGRTLGALGRGCWHEESGMGPRLLEATCRGTRSRPRVRCDQGPPSWFDQISLAPPLQAEEIGAGCGDGRRLRGDETALPDREVLRDFLEEGWDVMATTTRGKNTGPSLPMTLANRGMLDQYDVRRFSLHLSWKPSTGLQVEPAAAKITLNDLIHYETAAE